MRVGVMVPQAGRSATRRTLMENARFLEDLGYDAIWVGDHLFVPTRPLKHPYPYSPDGQFPVPPSLPFLDPVATMGFLAGCTERIRIGAGVLVLPYRHPLENAKVSATLDWLTEGRFILGVGVGWLEEEFDALGVPFGERGQRAEEQIRALRALFAGEESFEGRFYRFEGVGFAPRPLRMPLWVGGDSASARRRAGLYGDAWFPALWGRPVEAIGREHQEVRRWAESAGRDPDAVGLSLLVPLLMGEGEVAEGAPLEGALDRLKGLLESCARQGVQEVVLNFATLRQPQRARVWEAVARWVLPAVR